MIPESRTINYSFQENNVFHLSLGGVNLLFRLPGNSSDLVRNFLSPFRASQDDKVDDELIITGEEEGWKLQRNKRVIIEQPSVDNFLLMLDRFLCQKYIQTIPPGTLVAHAAVIYQSGNTFAFIGGSGAGKTTAALKAIVRGSNYISEEMLGINLNSGLLYPFPRPLSLEHSFKEEIKELKLIDTAHNSFFYGLPENNNTISCPYLVKDLKLIFLDRGKKLSRFKFLTTGQTYQRLFAHLFKPEGFEKRMDILKNCDLSLSGYRLSYGEIDNHLETIFSGD